MVKLNSFQTIVPNYNNRDFISMMPWENGCTYKNVWRILYLHFHIIEIYYILSSLGMNLKEVDIRSIALTRGGKLSSFNDMGNLHLMRLYRPQSSLGNYIWI